MQSPTKRLALALVAATALAACQQRSSSQPPPAALPLDTASAAPLTEAPAGTALPAAPAAPVASVSDPTQIYQDADQAWAMSDAFGDSPPDYAFDDGGVTPWVWTAGDNAICIAEAVPGGERYYYYQPGADQPFYVQGQDFGYAFQDGALVGVYDRSGRGVPVAGHADIAGRYLARAETLRRTATGAPHRAVAAGNWTAQRRYVAAQRARFSSEAAANPGWNAYHAQHAAQEQAKWAPEATKREAWAATTDTRLGNQADADRERAAAQAARRAPTPASQAPDRTPVTAAPERPRAAEAAASRPAPGPRTEAAARSRPAAEASRAAPATIARREEAAPPTERARAPERAAPAAEPRAPERVAPTTERARAPEKAARAPERAKAPDDKRP